MKGPRGRQSGQQIDPSPVLVGIRQAAYEKRNSSLVRSSFRSPRFSRLRLDGLRPTGGVKGSAYVCTSRGVIQRLDLSGTIYGGWRSTEGSLLEFRLLEPKIFDVGQRQGSFDLFGRWHGPELVMDDRGESGNRFRSGLRIDRASVSLDWGGYSDFKVVCASSADFPAYR
jgi:hypothetical protein